MGWCVIDAGGTICDWRVVDLSPSVKKPTIARLVEGAAAFVASLDDGTVEVRIEQQPNQNVCMKVLSHVLQGLFLAHGAPSVRIVSPKSYKRHGGALTTYSKRKKDSVDRVRAMVAGDSQWSDFYASHRKQDDLADALLLARWTSGDGGGGGRNHQSTTQ
jgi:hypothetical protein